MSLLLAHRLCKESAENLVHCLGRVFLFAPGKFFDRFPKVTLSRIAVPHKMRTVVGTQLALSEIRGGTYEDGQTVFVIANQSQKRRPNMRSKYFMALWCALAVVPAAQAGIWGDYIASGSACNSGTVSVLENGDSLAVLFDSFGVNMPQGSTGDGLSSRKTCNFRIEVTPPRGFYLAGFTQVYSGGLIKSRRSSAQLNITYNIGAVRGRPLPITWSEGREITPEDEASLFSKSYRNDLLIASCGGKAVYGLNMNMTATRKSVHSDFVIGGLDSVDAELVKELVLIPEWRLCR